MRRFAVTLLMFTLMALGLAGCGSNNNGTSAGSSSSTPSASSSALSVNITVFAAASLTETFTELGKQFEAANPGTKVTFSFGASSALAEQINNGAPADVFASASPKNMDQVVCASRRYRAVQWRSRCSATRRSRSSR
jgi:molybdate transport system substrate-binding protein